MGWHSPPIMRSYALSCQAQVEPWPVMILSPLPHLSTPHASGLARWTLAMVLVRSWVLSAFSGLLVTRL